LFLPMPDRADFGAPDQLCEVGGHVVGAGVGREVCPQVADAEPVHARVWLMDMLQRASVDPED
jgi:hypothetical protein